MDEKPEGKLVYCEVFPPDIIKLYNTNLFYEACNVEYA